MVKWNHQVKGARSGEYDDQRIGKYLSAVVNDPLPYLSGPNMDEIRQSGAGKHSDQKRHCTLIKERLLS